MPLQEPQCRSRRCRRSLPTPHANRLTPQSDQRAKPVAADPELGLARADQPPPRAATRRRLERPAGDVEAADAGVGHVDCLGCHRIPTIAILFPASIWRRVGLGCRSLDGLRTPLCRSVASAAS